MRSSPKTRLRFSELKVVLVYAELVEVITNVFLGALFSTRQQRVKVEHKVLEISENIENAFKMNDNKISRPRTIV